MKYEVIDNFLDEEYFDTLFNLFTDKASQGCPVMSWYFQSDIEGKGERKLEKEDKLFYMIHVVYNENKPNSNIYETMIPLLEKLKAKCLIRIKANLYPHTETLYEHQMHIDYPFLHSGAILSLNTCDGYTKLKDGTKIDSVANRVLIFNSSEEHCSTTTTNVPARFNININYI